MYFCLVSLCVCMWCVCVCLHVRVCAEIVITQRNQFPNGFGLLKNYLASNLAKCHAMLVSNKESHDGFYVTIDETDIYYIHNRTVRGVCIDSNLNFNEKKFPNMRKGQQTIARFTETQELIRQKRLAWPFMIALSCQILTIVLYYGCLPANLPYQNSKIYNEGHWNLV